MTNINIEIPDDVYKKAKLAAILQDKTVKEFIIQRIEEEIRRRKR
jgi:hypothetical protein